MGSAADARLRRPHFYFKKGLMDDALERDTIGMSFFDPLDDQVRWGQEGGIGLAFCAAKAHGVPSSQLPRILPMFIFV
jgi:hypothetical protein